MSAASSEFVDVTIAFREGIQEADSGCRSIGGRGRRSRDGHSPRSPQILHDWKAQSVDREKFVAATGPGARLQFTFRIIRDR